MRCGKKTYPSRSQAKDYARRMAGKPLREGAKRARLSPYLCADCGFWHLTSADMAGKEFHRTRKREDT